MTTIYFLKGAILGFAIAAPVGPIGILCIRKTLEYGRFSGLFSGLGAAVADAIYGAVAAFGLAFISDYLIMGEFWLRLIGGAFLIYLGAATYFAKANKKTQLVTHKTLVSDFVSTFFLTMTNPMTILSFAAVFAGVGLAAVSRDYLDASWLVFGVFVGSALWWLILSGATSLLRGRLDTRRLIWVNRISGGIILAFGVLALASVVR